MSSAAAAVRPPFPLPPPLSSCVDPENYHLHEVNAAIREAAFLSMFTVPDPSRPNIPILNSRGNIIGVHVHEQPHRFEIHPTEPSLAGGVRAVNTVGEPVATVTIRWMPCPDDFEAGPGLEPPPTELDPTRSQRFVMLDGAFTFEGQDAGGFHAFGAGRTFPAIVGGRPQLLLGSVITSLQGFGRMEGLTATNVVNGIINPPTDLLLCFLWRVVDPSRRLRSSGEIPQVRAIPDPAPGITVMAFLGETDPNETVTLNLTPDGQMLGSNVVERLRLVHIGWQSGSGGVKARLSEGPIVGSLRGTLHFNPLDPRPVFPIHTTDGVLSFFDRRGSLVGWLNANITEGRAFPMHLPPAPLPVFRFGGFGPFNQGGGCFAGASGMMSLNAVVSVFPRTLTNMYVLRFDDPEGRFRAAMCDAWL